jgi:hypothetical protein
VWPDVFGHLCRAVLTFERGQLNSLWMNLMAVVVGSSDEVINPQNLKGYTAAQNSAKNY